MVTLVKGNDFSRKEVSLVYQIYPPVFSILLEIRAATLFLMCLASEAVPQSAFYDVSLTIIQTFLSDVN